MMTYRGRVYTQVKVGPARQQQHRKNTTATRRKPQSGRQQRQCYCNTAKTTARLSHVTFIKRTSETHNSGKPHSSEAFSQVQTHSKFSSRLKKKKQEKFISLNSQRKHTSSLFTDVVLLIQTSIPCSNSKCPPKTIVLLDTPTLARSVKVDSDAPSAQNKHEKEGAGRQSNSSLDLRGLRGAPGRQVARILSESCSIFTLLLSASC